MPDQVRHDGVRLFSCQVNNVINMEILLCYCKLIVEICKKNVYCNVTQVDRLKVEGFQGQIMRDHTKLRAFKLADEGTVLV